MVADREAAEEHVAELMPTELARRRHHPAHAERGADLFGVAGAPEAGADDFLERDDIGIGGGEHRGDAFGSRAPIHPARSVDVVGDDAQVDGVAERRPDGRVGYHRRLDGRRGPRLIPVS